MFRPVMGQDMYDGHEARGPADGQDHQTVHSCQVFPVPGGEVKHEVETLGHVSHGVTEADGDVKEDNLEDNESREGLECSLLREVVTS